LENGNTELYIAEWDDSQWMVIGAAEMESGTFNTVRMASSPSELFIVISSTDSGNEVSVNSYDGYQWFSLPDVQNYTGSSIGTADISVHNGDPVVAITENNFLIVKKFSESSPTSLENSPISTPELHCYPNPTNGLLELVIPESGLYQIDITSLTGQLIHTMRLNGKSTLLDMSSHEEGIYFITVRNEDYIKTQKIIKR
jgi:hypothetical protein